MPKKLKAKEFLRRLTDFGVIVHPNPARGKGSEIVLLKPNSPDSLQGPQFTLPHHGSGRDLKDGIVLACLRRFGIDKDEFLKGL